MTISTYDELNTAVSNWLSRDDLTARIPEFIVLAEAKFNRALKCRQMEQRSTTSVDLSTNEPEFISLPGDFQTMRRMRIASVDRKPRLQFLPSAALDEERTKRGDTPGMPCFYTLSGDEIELCPTPDTAYSLEMTYRRIIPALASSNITNWLLTFAPDLYLYGALLESAPHIKEDARIQVWAAGVSQAIDSLNALSIDAGFNAGPLQVRTSGATP